MTCRELVVYILENGLEDEPVFKDGTFVGFLTVDEAARSLMVGPATVRAWVELNMLDAILPTSDVYIPVVCKSVLGHQLNPQRGE